MSDTMRAAPQPSWPQCERCDAVARHGVRDIIRNEVLNGQINLEPLGDAHWYCDQHNRESITVVASEALRLALQSARLLD